MSCRAIDAHYNSIITHVDQGALYSWKVRESCSADGEFGPRSYVHLGACGDPEHHLTTMLSGAIVSDVVWNPSGPADPAVEPILQLEDGSFAGTAPTGSGEVLLVFNTAGGKKWILPDYRPVMATAGGGLIAQKGYDHYAFDADGTAIGQVASIPTYSWIKQSYTSTTAGIAHVAMPDIDWGTSFAALASGHPSPNRTSVGVAESHQGFPVFGLLDRGGSCVLPAPDGSGLKELLTSSGDALQLFALQQYTGAKDRLLAHLDALPSPSMCSGFFSGDPAVGGDPLRAGYFNLLRGAVERQWLYDGTRSTISEFRAGMITPAETLNPFTVSVTKRAPVCGRFAAFKDIDGYLTVPVNLATARSQITATERATATDVYLNTALLVPALLTQATVLHEALHNLTGLYDGDLRSLLGLPASSGPTDDISRELEEVGCAGTN